MRAQGSAGPSDLVHFVVKSVVEKVGSERIFVLVNFSYSDLDCRALGEGRLS